MLLLYYIINKTQAKEAVEAIRRRDVDKEEAVQYIETILSLHKITSDSLHFCDKKVLLRIAIEAGTRLKISETETKSLKQQLSIQMDYKQKFLELKKAMKELQDAHILQGKFIQKLQRQQGKVKNLCFCFFIITTSNTIVTTIIIIIISITIIFIAHE